MVGERGGTDETEKGMLYLNLGIVPTIWGNDKTGFLLFLHLAPHKTIRSPLWGFY